MTESPAGIFFTVEELTVLFPRLKQDEAAMNRRERQIFSRMEKMLYDHLSVREIEELGGSRG